MDTRPAAKPFDLWHLVPSALQAFLPNVAWNRERLHALPLPVTEISLDELRWQLDLPWWRTEQTDAAFSITPNEVRGDHTRFARHWRRTLDADVNFPLHLLQRDRLIMLDGMHRLLKADLQARRWIAVHVVTFQLFSEQVVELASAADDPSTP